MPVMKLKWGDLEVLTSSEKCRDAINDYFDQVLSNGRENHCIKAAPKHDPDCVLANTLAAYVTFYGDRSDASAHGYLRSAERNLDQATPYEKRVFDALCHIFQHECHFRQAVEFMEGIAETGIWDNLQAFMFTHNWWHVSLCYLEGNAPIKYVWEIHEKYLWAQMKKEKEKATSRGKVYLNDIGLLLRVHVRESYDGALRGYECSMLKKRLETLTKSLMNDLQYISNREWFVDILLLWVLSHMKKDDQAQNLLGDLEIKMGNEKHEKRKDRMQKGLELARASYHYGKREYEKALELLEPDFDAVHYKVIGASGEQIDVFNEVYIDMLLKTKRGMDAVVFILKQLEGRKGAPFLWRLGSEAIKVVESNMEVDGEGNSETIKILEELSGVLAELSKEYEAFNHLT